jgi:hypothetical protein
MRLEDATSGMAVAIALEGANQSAGEVADGYLVFAKAHATGAALLQRPLRAESKT